MCITTDRARVSVHVGVCVHPDHVQVPVLLQRSEHIGRRNRVVTADVQRLMQQTTLPVQFLVSVGRVKLDVLNAVRCGVTYVLETVLVNVDGADINTWSALALVALGQDGLEFAKSLKNVL